MKALPGIEQMSLGGRRVFMRVDFNTPLENGRITDDSRIRAAIPTIEYALEKGARLLLASHLGRPKGEVDPSLSMEPVGARLAELLACGEVMLADEVSGDGVRRLVGSMRDGQVALLENLRFDPREKKNDDGFARELTKLADAYVCDAFGVLHRAHTSVDALPRLFSERGAGFLVNKEVEVLTRLREWTERPYLALLGGSKVSTKIDILETLIRKVDGVLIGGAMANTFLAAKGVDVKASLVEADRLPVARSLIAKAEAAGVELHLPLDCVTSTTLDAPEGAVCSVDSIPDGEMILDIGPETVKAYGVALSQAKAVFWNGPMGVFEKPAFAKGTFELAQRLALVDAFTVIGGGDSVAAIRQSGLAKEFNHLSTGGGASMAFLEGRKLPGISALSITTRTVGPGA